MPRKKIELFDSEDIFQLDTQEEIQQFIESYTIGGFDNYSESRYVDYDSDNYAYEEYGY